MFLVEQFLDAWFFYPLKNVFFAVWLTFWRVFLASLDSPKILAKMFKQTAKNPFFKKGKKPSIPEWFHKGQKHMFQMDRSDIGYVWQVPRHSVTTHMITAT